MFSNVWKYSLFAFLTLGMVAVSPVWADDDEKLPQNIILLIGDGMGEHHVQAAGLFRFGDQYRSNNETRFEWEKFPFLKGDVYPKAIFLSPPRDFVQAPDSAATGTTIATGVITQVGRIAMDAKGRVESETLLEFYRDRGKATGLVTTSRMPHATPAAFGAHDPDRDNETEIALDYLNQTKPNLLLGGRARLDPSDITGGGYTHIKNRAELLSEAAKSFDFDNSVLIWGEFTTGSHMGFEADDALFKTATFYVTRPHLSEMAQAALDILSQDVDGFFLMIEGGRIDPAAHIATATRLGADDAYKTELYEILEFNNAVKAVVDWLEDQPKSVKDNTIIVVTADHETGLLTILDDLYATPIDGCDIFRVKNVLKKCEFPMVDYLTSEEPTRDIKSHSDYNVPLYVRGPNSSSALFARDQIDVHKILKGERIGPKISIR